MLILLIKAQAYIPRVKNFSILGRLNLHKICCGSGVQSYEQPLSQGVGGLVQESADDALPEPEGGPDLGCKTTFVHHYQTIKIS